jgi:hypothetical protein
MLIFCSLLALSSAGLKFLEPAGLVKAIHDDKSEMSMRTLFQLDIKRLQQFIGEVVIFEDDYDSCEKIARNITGMILLTSENGCPPAVKANYAHQAGAIAVILTHYNAYQGADSNYWNAWFSDDDDDLITIN